MATNGERPANTEPTQSKLTAVILAGAAAKGPYAAGALSEIARDTRFKVRCVLGTSSGALNAAVYAAGLRVRQEQRAADRLCELWQTKATWPRILTAKKRVRIVRDALTEFSRAGPVNGRSPVELQVIVTSLSGHRDEQGRFTFEETYAFRDEDFEDERKLDWMAELCVASSAIPVVFSPRKVRGRGPYWDGGIVNNAPIGHALKRDDGIDHLIVITPDRQVVKERRYCRLSVGRLFEMLIEERLNRDLHEARSFNEAILKLSQMGLELSLLEKELAWRLLQFVEVRPDSELLGNSLAGFASSSLRAQYIASGRSAARNALRKFRLTLLDLDQASGSAHSYKSVPAD